MDKTFYRNLLAITMPIAFQNIISYSVNMMDTLMLGSLGETVLSASSLAGQVFFCSLYLYLDWDVEQEFYAVNILEKEI